MIIVNTEGIEGKSIVKTLGVVNGSTIRAKHIGKDILASFNHVAGGEMEGYSKMLGEARGIAIERMTKKAEKMGANAILNVRFTTSSIIQGALEVLVYGTAVVIE